MLLRVDDDNDVPIEPGTYRRFYDYWSEHCEKQGRPNTYWAEICCFQCLKVALLGSNHTVRPGGVFHPSDVCPFAPSTAGRGRQRPGGYEKI